MIWMIKVTDLYKPSLQDFCDNQAFCDMEKIQYFF